MRTGSIPRLLLITLLALLVVGAVAWWGLWRAVHTHVQVVNATGEAIEALRISFPGHECRFEGVLPDRRVECRGRAQGEGEISVEYLLASGSRFHWELKEYMGPSYGWRGTAVLRPGGKTELHQ